MKTPVKSIRRYLLASLIIALTTGSLLVAVFTYFNAAGEIDELYDKNMVEIAETLKTQMSALNLEEYHVKGTLGPSLKETIKEEQEFLVQVWDKNGTSIYTSHRAIPYPFQEKRGAHQNDFQDKSWRTYGAETDDFVIQISQPQRARIRYVREVSLNLLFPMLLLIPVVGFLIWVAVGKSLNPLSDISDAITKRSATSLDPIAEESIPVEIRPLVQELNELLVRLNNSLEAQRNFTADAAHQLRTPLTALQLQLANLKRAKTDLERERNASKLQDGIDRATHLVQQLLSLARVEPNAMDAPTTPVNLAAIVHDVVKQHAEMAMQKNIHVGMPQDESVIVPGNTENLCTLLENLISNALRYTPQGGKVNINLYKSAGNAVIEVQDNGIGIPAADRERIFERFYRVLGTEVEGTGLGLSIAQNIVEQHSGAIRIGEGIDGRGASFTVTLPL
ncbi:MAG: ATP-binding protein [Rickettsiales bacterium]